ncbi:MAG: gluconate 2-dehydrogenase subunit 3 family protein [Nitrospira sp.]|nr:gluconate 2-dehydrogenase subunit 3 family protein [Nitrospira sp.]
MKALEKDDEYILNHCTRYLARTNTDERHNFGQYPTGDPRGRVCEAWRFPIVDTFFDGQDPESSYRFNKVTFVYRSLNEETPSHVAVVGTFTALYDPVPLSPVTLQDEETGYYAVSVQVPKGEVHTYQYLVDGQLALDSINPQRIELDNGKIWSSFFTQFCSQPIRLDRHEYELLIRLTDHVLPFRTRDAQNFLNRFYNMLDRQTKETQYSLAYQLDESVGVANFLDKLLAKEENHHLIDYRICLGQIDRILRQRYPQAEPAALSKEAYIEIYADLASGRVNGWDYESYGNPQYFLQLLRRHTYTGAFSHPKYGGNVGAAGWAYLEETYRDAQNDSAFDWRRAMERPLGRNPDYHG